LARTPARRWRGREVVAPQTAADERIGGRFVAARHLHPREQAALAVADAHHPVERRIVIAGVEAQTAPMV